MKSVSWKVGKVGLGLALVSGFVMGGGVTANASTSNDVVRAQQVAESVASSADPLKTYRSLNDQQKDLYNDFYTVKSIKSASQEISPRAAAALADCPTHRESRQLVNAFGIALADYWTTGQSCGGVLSIIDAGGFTGAVGVRYDGEVKRQSGDSNGVSYGYSQQKFIFGAAGVDIRTETPCARVIDNKVVLTGDGVCGIG